MNFSANPNPYGHGPHSFQHFELPQEFEMSDYLFLGDTLAGGDSSSSQSLASSEKVSDCYNNDGSSGGVGAMSVTSRNNNIKCKSASKKKKMEEEIRVAFRTKSELEIMDDGFKWRKYGKKSVKNSPNPRNYYRCSSGGCNVKKRVERDSEDSSYVITSYDGVHNHESPCVVYYSQMPPMIPNSNWSLQPSSNFSSPSP